MKGTHRIVVSNASVKYEFTIRRNITIIKGDSATGKTTLVELINEYYESGSESGIELQCDKTCRVISGKDWALILPSIKDSIVFIDEDNDFLTSTEFADAVKNSDNYYCLVTREGLPNLPYSVNEIYGIRTSGKYAGLKQSYHEFFHIYGNHVPNKAVEPKIVIVEDSNSGYEFFAGISKDKGYEVKSAYGKSNIFFKVCGETEATVIIADGAAFGSEMDRLMKLMSNKKNLTLLLPESFEWLILESGTLQDGTIRKVLDEPSNYIDSKEYFSWERFFTGFLIERTNGTYLQYTKKKLNPAFLQGAVAEKILSVIKDINL